MLEATYLSNYPQAYKQGMYGINYSFDKILNRHTGKPCRVVTTYLINSQEAYKQGKYGSNYSLDKFSTGIQARHVG